MAVSYNYSSNNGTRRTDLTAPATGDADFAVVGAESRNGVAGTITRATLVTNRASSTSNTQVYETNAATNEGLFNFPDGLGYSNNVANQLNETRNLSTETEKGSAAAGNLIPFSYTSFGNWSDCTANCNTPGETGVFGTFVYGSRTNPANIPTTGQATYTGVSRGIYRDGAGNLNNVDANVSATANFVNRSINFSTTGTMSEPFASNTAVAAPNLNINGVLSYAAGSNQFTGAVSATGLSGNAIGNFYGPAAQEIGGVYNLTGTGGQLTGDFIAK